MERFQQKKHKQVYFAIANIKNTVVLEFQNAIDPHATC